MSKMVQKTCEGLQMSAVEAQQAIWRLAPRDWIGKRKAAITKVARELGWKFARTWNIAHGRARRIDSYEMDALRAELNKLQESASQRHEDLHELEARIAFLRSAEGGGNVVGSSQGVAAHSRRSNGAGASGMRSGEYSSAALPGR